MDDIVPALYDKILKDFKSHVALDPWIKAFRKRLKKGNATQNDVQEYAGRVGRYGQDALIRGLQRDNLPDGKLYWNIVKRTVEPLMRLMTDMVNDAYKAELGKRYKRMGIHIKLVTVGFNQERCDDIMNKLVAEGNTDVE